MIQMTVYDRMRATCHVIASANTRVVYVSSSPLASFLSFFSQDFRLEQKTYVPGPHGPTGGWTEFMSQVSGSRAGVLHRVTLLGWDR
jgi:hypothetical protein